MQNPLVTIILDDEKQKRFHKTIYQNRLTEIYDMIKSKEDEIKELKEEAELCSSFLSLISPVEVGNTHSDVDLLNVVIATNPIRRHSTTDFVEKYDPASSLAKKCEVVISESNELLSTREVAHKILDHENDYLKKKEISFDRFQKNIGSTLLQKVEKRDTFRREKINGEFKYGLLSDRTI